MQVHVRKWGNSASVRIPVVVLAASNLDIDQCVDIRAENGRIIIEPVQEDDLDSLVAQITPANRHAEVSFGAVVGQEAF